MCVCVYVFVFFLCFVTCVLCVVCRVFVFLCFLCFVLLFVCVLRHAGRESRQAGGRAEEGRRGKIHYLSLVLCVC